MTADMAYHLDASPRPALQAAWGWRECGDCGAVFLGPEGRRKCLRCRLGVESAPPAHWFPDEDDDAGAPLVPEGAPAGGQDDAPEAPQVVERGEDVPGVLAASQEGGCCACLTAGITTKEPRSTS